MAEPEPEPVAPKPEKPQKPERSFEDLLGGRILAWLGGLAILVGVILFLVIAVDRGWIGVEARVALAFAGSTMLLAVGLFLYERRGQTEAAVAAVASALAALYASLTYATAVRASSRRRPGSSLPLWSAPSERRSPFAGDRSSWPPWRFSARSPRRCSSAARRRVSPSRSWSSRWSGQSPSSLAALGLARPRRTPDQRAAARVLGVDRDDLVLPLTVLALYWCLFVVAAIGYELRVPTSALRASSASVLLLNAGLVTALGWSLVDDRGSPEGATLWVLAVTAAHIALGGFGFRQRMSGEIAALLVAVGVGLSGVTLALALDGPALVAGWSAEAAILAWVAARTGERRALVFSCVFLGLAALHTARRRGTAGLRSSTASTICRRRSPRFSAWGSPRSSYATSSSSSISGSCSSAWARWRSCTRHRWRSWTSCRAMRRSRRRPHRSC